MTSKSSMEELKKEWSSKMNYFTTGKNSEKIMGFWLDEESLDQDAVWSWITTNFIPREEVEGIRIEKNFNAYTKNTWFQSMD
jgi:hypothetical protein